jgi:hypothetical protein
MIMASRAIVSAFLLFASCVYGQDTPLEQPASDFNLKGVGLTETLLKFAQQQHLRIAVEYVDKASMEQSIDVTLKGKTVRQALDSILRNGRGYRWQLRNGIIEITNSHASKHAKAQLNKVIPIFEIPEGETVRLASAMLWWNLQIALDPKLSGFAGHVMGESSAVKPNKLRNRTARDILSYIVVNSQAEAWIVSGPPKCLGYTPYCGLWFLIEGGPYGSSYDSVLQKVRENL